MGLLLVLRNAERLKRLNADLEVSRDAAQAANRARASFLAVMSHEVRTPLNGVMGMTQLLQASDLTAMQADYARTALECAASLKQIMDDVLDYSLLDSGALQLKPELFELIPSLEELAEGFAQQAHAKGLGFDWVFSPDLPVRVLGDSIRVRQIVGHLLSNAVKFSETGRVSLEVLLDSHTPGNVRISVRDTGIGLSPQSLVRLMAPFEQEDSSSTRRFGGVGLGLSICHRLLGMMGGCLSVESTPGQGACFEVSIPLPASHWDKTPCVPSPALAGYRIWLISHNVILREGLEPWLLFWGAQLDSMESLEQALSELERSGGTVDCPDLIVLDTSSVNGRPESVQNRLESALHGRACALIHLVEESSMPLPVDGEVSTSVVLLRKPGRMAHLAQALLKLRAVPVQALSEGQAVSCASSEAVRVLLVEDNRINQKVAMAMLRMLGVQVETANNGREAVEILSRECFDLVLMDIQMPEMDGIEATRMIRDPASEVLEHAVPIVALTANALAVHREECFAAGMDDFLSKPLAQDALCAVLEKHIPQGFALPA